MYLAYYVIQLNDSEDFGQAEKLKQMVCIFIGLAPAKKAYRIYNRHTKRIMETIHVYFDDLTEMASEQSSSGPALHEMTPGTLRTRATTSFFNTFFDAPISAVSTGSPSLTSVDQDAPSLITHMDNHPYIGIPISEPSSEESSSHVVNPNNVHSLNQPPKHISKWTKDHPIDNVIALTESCWIEAMQEELNEFKLLEVWELLPRPYHVMIITLKWIYKVKLDELGDPDNPNHVYKLKKALYGLKQAPRA
ncbi:retrovirus-related pol polyprotein from transposon TNT 1-94, partial [Tanacetum coccineum]